MPCAGIPLGSAIWLSDAGFIEVVIPFDVARVAAFNQQPVTDGRRPLNGSCLIDRRIPLGPSCFGINACSNVEITPLEHPVHVRIKHVSSALLPRLTHEYDVDHLSIDVVPYLD